MEKYKDKYRTESTRLQYWDYSSPGYYFITICTKNREDYFGEIKNEKICLNKIGNVAQRFWLEIPNHFSNVTLNEFVIMPNHVHGIVVINDATAINASNVLTDDVNNVNDANNVETRQCLVSTNVDITKTVEHTNRPPTTGQNIGKNRFQNQGKNTISSIIGSYKSVCTKTINKTQNQFHFAWQPRFYEHIIRSTKSLERIRHYILNNPTNWHLDRNNL
ncbi:transposase [Candidatus Falkowbacteria bacterium]|jgi:putative transposase|nr:transposase [Candidatus Falkowbacteria bacterium]MBT7007116.1 transposase [Candidatus Falkowbacteria bacterium]